MGQQESQMEQVTGTTNLRINRSLNSDQLLVKLCRNGKEWLSPVGWVKEEKGTLLECKSEKGSSIVEIPAEFGKKLKKGDTVVLKSLESGFESELIWGKGPEVKPSTKKANGSIPVAAAVSGLMALEETEKRAHEAEKAAANYKEKMNAAAKAREAAQTAALEAARKADEALKAEAERIAEMEQAAKAFEEAEKLRLDEQRRLEKGRRIEEERRLEEARIAEEARLKAHAEIVRKERAEARKNIKGEIAKIKAEKSKLEEVLANAKGRLSATESSLADTDQKLERLDKSLSKARKIAAESKTVLDTEQSEAEKFQIERTKINETVQTIDRDNEKLSKRLEKAEAVYLKAKKETEEARLRELEHLKAFDLVKGETNTAKSQKDALIQQGIALKEKVSAHERNIGNYKDAFSKAHKAVENEESQVETAKKTSERLKQELTEAKTDQARALEKILVTDADLAKRKEALSRVDDLDNAEDIRLLGNNQLSSPKVKLPKPVKTEEESTGFLGKLFGRNKSTDKTAPIAATAAAVKTVKTEVTEKTSAISEKKTPILKSDVLVPKTAKDSASARGRLNSWLMIGAALGTVTLIGSSYAIANKSGAPKQIKSAAAKPTAKVVKSKTAEVTQTAALTRDFNVMTDVSEALTVSSKDAAETPKIDKKAALEIPAKVEKATPKTTPKTTAAKPIVKTAAAVQPVRRSKSNYPVVTQQVQEGLMTMGYYQGEINGLQTVETQKAIIEFKSIFDLPVNHDITPELMTKLSRTIDDRKDAQALLEFIDAEQPEEKFQVADNSNDVYFFETPVETATDQALSTALTEPVSTSSEFIPAVTETVKVAAATALPEEIEAPIVADVIIPAKNTRSAVVEYPSRALRDRDAINAKVFVTYDIDAQGQVINPRMKSIEFETVERYSSLFEKAAIRAIEKQRFDPRTVNGVAVTEENRTTRISFNVE